MQVFSLVAFDADVVDDTFASATYFFFFFFYCFAASNFVFRLGAGFYYHFSDSFRISP